MVISLGFLCSGVTRCVLWYQSYVSDLHQQVSFAESIDKITMTCYIEVLSLSVIALVNTNYLNDST